MTTNATTPTRNRLAIVALILGLFALVPSFWLAAGVAALVVGYLALVQINTSDGRQHGARLAVVGLLLGLVGCGLQVLWFFGIIVVSLEPYQARSTDMNHLRQIGVALETFQTANHRTYPRAVSPLSDLPVEERLSWMVLLLPYLEQRQGGRATFRDLAAQLDLSAAYEADVNAPARVPLRPYQSPRAPAETVPADFTSYRGIAGVGPDAIALPETDPRAGFFGYPRRIRPADLKAGTSYTLAVAGTTSGGAWARGGPGTAASIPPTSDDLFGSGRPFGGLYPDGLHLLFADGSVSFRSEDLPASLFRQLALINREQ